MKVFLSHILLLMIPGTVAVNATGRVTVKSADAIYTGVVGEVHYCEPDKYITDNVIFTQLFSLYTTDGVTSSNIAGSFRSGYRDGVGKSARFHVITGLYQWNDTVVVAVDSFNHCLRHVFRDINQTGTLTGNCTHSGSADGVGKEAHFHFPIDVILDHTDTGVLLITDGRNNAIRSINMESLFVSTVLNIASPERIEWSADNSSLYVSHSTGGTSSIKWGSKEVTRLISDTTSKPYNQIFYDAIDQDHTDFAHLYGPYFVIVHANIDDTVHIVNMQERQGWELCIGTSSNCSFDARSVNAHKNSLLIGSDDGSITQYSGFDCTLEPPCPEGILVDSHIGCLCCRQGYTGPNCRIESNECESCPCVHGACTDLVNAYNCSCDAGYEGKDCDSDIDDCEDLPCVHGACTDLVDDFSCECEEGYQGRTCALELQSCHPGYTGLNCSIDINDCESSPCVHGACTDLVDAYNCSCKAGYEGKDCDSNIDDCEDLPCVHGACTDLVDDFSCECEEGYQGRTCALATTTTPSKGSNSSIIITGIGVGSGALAVLVITLLLIIVWQRAKIQRIQKAENSPAITMSSTSATVSTANDSVQHGETRRGVPIHRMAVAKEYPDITEYESLTTAGTSNDDHVYSKL